MFEIRHQEIPSGLAPVFDGLEHPQQRPQGPAIQARIRHFGISFYSSAGAMLGEHTFSFECGAHPSTDIAFFRMQNGVLQIAVQEVFKPALALRAQLPVLTEGERFGPHRCLPSEHGWAANTLGGPYLPTAGSSTETCMLSPVEHDGSAESLDSGLKFVPVQEILSDYLGGTPSDTRLLLAALRLSARYGIPLSIDLPIEARTRFESQVDCAVPKRDAAFLRENLSAPPLDPAAAYTVLCRERPPQRQGFLRHLGLEIHDDDSGIGPRVGEAVIRRGIDSVDVGAYTWFDGDLCLVLKRGLRPALTARALSDGGTPAPTSALAYEGIAESLEGEMSIPEIAARAAQGVREEAGIEPIGTPIYLGSSFPSPHLHTEKVFNVLIEVDPRYAVEAEHTVDERVDAACVPVRDIIRLCDEGVICDPRLEINARLLAHCLPEGG
jgi:hypothetical protein